MAQVGIQPRGFPSAHRQQLNGEIFDTLSETRIIFESWHRHYNPKQPHSALGCRPPTPEVMVPMETRPIMH